MKKILLIAAGLLLGAMALSAQNAVYGIKSGHLKYETQTSGGVQYNEVWFDDYGQLRKQHDQIMMEGMGTQFAPEMKEVYCRARPDLEAYYSTQE